MSDEKANTISSSISSHRSDFDSAAKPEHEKTSPICSGVFQNVPFSTWVEFDASNCMDKGAQADENVSSLCLYKLNKLLF